MEYYVYTHTITATKELYYVGKGKGGRAWSRNRRNEYWERVTDKHETDVEIVYHSFNEKEAFRVEEIWIDIYRPRTNLTKGGSGGDTSKTLPKHPKSKQVVLLNDGTVYMDYKEAAKANGLHPKIVQKCCRNRQFSTDKDLMFCYVGMETKRPSYKQDKRSIICSNGQSFSSCIEASKVLDINDKSLNNHLRGKTQFVMWNEKPLTAWYLGDLEKPVTNIDHSHLSKRSVICLNNGKTYESAREAAKDLDISYQHITCVCKGKRRTHFGYFFEYKLI